MESGILRKYSNGEITIVWKPAKCIHSAVCWRGRDGLPQVFNPKKKPWIAITGSDSQTIMYQIDQCPSGALSYFKNTDITIK